MSYYKQLPSPIKAVWVMRNKTTGEFVSCNKREAWGSKGAAKLSYRASVHEAFNEQDVYEIINILEMVCK